VQPYAPACICVTYHVVMPCSQVWFPPNWASRLSSFDSLTTFDHLLLLLNKAPAVPFTSSSYSSWAAQGVLVSAALMASLHGLGCI
jgi:hypothetical protein